MFDPLLWVLHHFVIHYAGQTNQGDKNNGDGADQASDSKQDTGLLQGTTPTTLPPTLQESNTPSQSDASSSVDLQPGEECKGGYRIRKVSKSFPQQPSPPGSQPFTSYVPPQSDEMPPPVYLKEFKVKSYLRNQNPDEYNAFIVGEARPPNLLIPYEFAIQMHLSRPGHENPYVPTTFDYIILEDEYILVMEYFGGIWVTLLSYVKGKEQPDIVDARDIVKEIVEAMINLKQYGILHKDIREENVMYNLETGKTKLIDFGISSILPGWEAGKSVPLKSPDPSSTSPDYKAGDDELWIDHCILCDQQLLSTSIAHLVVECEQVTGHRIQSGLVPAIQKSPLRLLGRALDPGVENVYTWLRGGVLNGEADLNQLVGWMRTVEHESMGTRHDNRMLAARLADFLQVAYRQYQSTLWQIPPGSPCGSWLY
ncbi:hypothetical protein BASA81_014349 [Batrachochytrium salamandrivorans]|nr:hypothetical protein BASA81_014349 [Batrachochytrium salamandrivorans]